MKVSNYNSNLRNEFTNWLNALNTNGDFYFNLKNFKIFETIKLKKIECYESEIFYLDVRLKKDIFFIFLYFRKLEEQVKVFSRLGVFITNFGYLLIFLFEIEKTNLA